MYGIYTFSLAYLAYLAQEKAFWALPSPHPLLYRLMKLTRLLEGGDEGGDGF